MYGIENGPAIWLLYQEKQCPVNRPFTNNNTKENNKQQFFGKILFVNWEGFKIQSGQITGY